MSAFTLSQFTSSLRTRNVSRPNLYYVDIIPPKFFTDNPNSFDKSSTGLVSMWCNAASTPQNTIITHDDYIEAGVRRKYAYDQDYQNLTLSFYVDQDYKIKRFFDQWKDAIVPQKRNFNYPEDYTADSLNLYILNQANQPTYKYEYSRIFPKSINQIELSYASGASISTFTVDFVFEEVYHTSMTEGTTNKPTIQIEERGTQVGNKEVQDSQTPNNLESMKMFYAPNMNAILLPFKSGNGGEFAAGGASGNFFE